jgi:hypothetical protein
MVSTSAAMRSTNAGSRNSASPAASCASVSNGASLAASGLNAPRIACSCNGSNAITSAARSPLMTLSAEPSSNAAAFTNDARCRA